MKHQMTSLQASFHYNKPQLNIITIILFLITIVQSINPKFEACTPQTCGNGPSIKYPFWIPYQQDSFCGYPQFEITCKNNNPILKTSTYDFLVKNISYSNSSLTATNIDFYEKNCPAPMYNYSLALDQTPFTYSSENSNLSFFYNCTTEPIDYPTYDVECAENDTHYSFAVFHKEALEHKSYSLNECEFMVNAPLVLNTSVNFTSLLKMSYIDVLKMGFVLNWTAPDCEHCERSGGRCGFDNYQFICFCKDKSYLKICGDDHDGLSTSKKILVIGLASVFGVLAVILAIYFYRRKKNISYAKSYVQSRSISTDPSSKDLERGSQYFGGKSSMQQVKFQLKANHDRNIEEFLKDHGALLQKRYKFSEIKKMTNSFKIKLGQGGFGVVYKGKLVNGSLVAVKILNSSKENGEDFINEVASITRTSHVNIVTLLGFCFEGRKKALVYEFMSNGSLDKFIYNKGPETVTSLSWDNLYQIAKGIARGLEYLHRGCTTRIFHFDIKPHNILLDENFCPKISDFGLAKLDLKKESIISMSGQRGTMGYVAPEMWSRHFGGVSHKSDVYSYGIMLLEMVGGRKNINADASRTSEIYFPHWVYSRLELGSDLRSDEIMDTEDDDIARRMTIAGLWCIQTFPNDRPTMSKVIEMLEGSMKSLEIPPKPLLSTPTRSES